MTLMVEITNVTKSFGDVQAVNDASLVVERGAFLTVVGPSGCGKTTLLRMIAGFETPSAGEIRIHGERVDSVPPYKRSIGMVFQRLALFPHMTAAQNIAYPLKMRRFSPSVIPGLVETYLRLVRLEGFGERRPHELSGGQQQRVAIARALVFSPDLLLLDEPLSALDRKLREDMQLEFRRIQRELGVTTINVTHDQREALVMSDRIAVMSDGIVQQAGSPIDLYRRPENSFVAGFIGVTSMFEGEVLSADNGAVRIRVGDTILKANGGRKPPASGSRVQCAIRAEQIRIAETQGSGNRVLVSFENAVDGIVRQRIFEGERILYEVEVPAMGGVTLRIFDHDPADHSEYAEGQTVRLEWQARDLLAFDNPAMVNQQQVTANQRRSDVHV
jgi:putative spermidine/putrescine transport system ATP-binding protein